MGKNREEKLTKDLLGQDGLREINDVVGILALQTLESIENKIEISKQQSKNI